MQKIITTLIITFLSISNGFSAGMESYFSNKGLYLQHSGKYLKISSFGRKEFKCNTSIHEMYNICIKLSKNAKVTKSESSVDIRRGNEFIFIKSGNLPDTQRFICHRFRDHCEKYKHMSEKSKINKYYNSVINITPQALLDAKKTELEALESHLIQKKMLVLNDAISIASVDVGSEWAGVITEQKNTNRDTGFYINLLNKNNHLIIMGRGFNVNYQ